MHDDQTLGKTEQTHFGDYKQFRNIVSIDLEYAARRERRRQIVGKRYSTGGGDVLRLIRRVNSCT